MERVNARRTMWLPICSHRCEFGCAVPRSRFYFFFFRLLSFRPNETRWSMTVHDRVGSYTAIRRLFCGRRQTSIMSLYSRGIGRLRRPVHTGTRTHLFDRHRSPTNRFFLPTFNEFRRSVFVAFPALKWPPPLFLGTDRSKYSFYIFDIIILF